MTCLLPSGITWERTQSTLPKEQPSSREPVVDDVRAGDKQQSPSDRCRDAGEAPNAGKEPGTQDSHSQSERSEHDCHPGAIEDERDRGAERPAGSDRRPNQSEEQGQGAASDASPYASPKA